jgi:hypothetical protein
MWRVEPKRRQNAVNELRMRARWKLGRLLAAMERAPGPGRGKKMSALLTSFRDFLGKLRLDRQTALVAQRIGALPEAELDKLLAEAHQSMDLDTFRKRCHMQKQPG